MNRAKIPTHEEFVAAVDALKCKLTQDYKGALEYMRLRFEADIKANRKRDLSPFSDDGGQGTDFILSIFLYTTNCYENINSRTESGDYGNVHAYFDMMLEALSRLPRVDAWVARGSNLQPSAYQVISSSKKNIFRFKNFLSASDEFLLPHKTHQLLILTQSGRKIRNFSSIPTEEETLIPPGSQFEILDKMMIDRNQSDLSHSHGLPALPKEWIGKEEEKNFNALTLEWKNLEKYNPEVREVWLLKEVAP